MPRTTTAIAPVARFLALSPEIDRMEAELAAAYATADERPIELLDLMREYALSGAQAADNVAQFLIRLKGGIAATKAHEKELAEARRRAERALADAEDTLLVYMTDGRPTADDIEPTMIEGSVYALAAQRVGGKPSVVVNRDDLPAEYYVQEITLSVPITDTAALARINAIADENGMDKPSVGDPEPDRKAIRASLEAGNPVPGAKLERSRFLKIKAPKTAAMTTVEE